MADERPSNRRVFVVEEERVVESAADDYVHFREAGDTAKGSYRCTDCGYGVAVTTALPACPMCGGSSWEEAAWSPFSRARELP